MITFKKIPRRGRWPSSTTSIEIKVDGERVGSICDHGDGDVGYSWATHENLGLSWFNTWAEKIRFADIDAAKRDVRERLGKALKARRD